MYFDYPLEQGLRQFCGFIKAILFYVFWLSIRTRIKTFALLQILSFRNRYFDYPLEQGLRQDINIFSFSWFKYFDYPLEQGLRLPVTLAYATTSSYFDYPLEQGLRLSAWNTSAPIRNVFWLSIRTRIKTEHLLTVHLSQFSYFDYPLEQGLRQHFDAFSVS